MGKREPFLTESIWKILSSRKTPLTGNQSEDIPAQCTKRVMQILPVDHLDLNPPQVCPQSKELLQRRQVRDWLLEGSELLHQHRKLIKYLL